MRMLRVVLTIALFSLAAAAGAQWELYNDRSSVNFISVKNSAIAETHSFTALVGFIGADGKVIERLDAVWDESELVEVLERAEST